MDSEIYLDLNTFIHRLDPRTKIFILLTIFVVVLYFQNPLWILPISLLVVLQGVVSRSLSNLKRIKYILFILVLSTMIMWNLFSKGETRLFWFIYLESFLYTLGRTLVMLTLITEGFIFLSTTRTEEFVMGMIRLRLPYRVGFAISTALRLVPTIFASVVTIGQAQRSRGLDLDHGTILERIRRFLPLLVPVFVSTIRGTNIFGMALESKGFGAREQRTFYLNPQYTRVDTLFHIFLVLLLVVTTVLKIAGFGNITGLIKF